MLKKLFKTADKDKPPQTSATNQESITLNHSAAPQTMKRKRGRPAKKQIDENVMLSTKELTQPGKASLGVKNLSRPRVRVEKQKLIHIKLPVKAAEVLRSLSIEQGYRQNEFLSDMLLIINDWTQTPSDLKKKVGSVFYQKYFMRD